MRARCEKPSSDVERAPDPGLKVRRGPNEGTQRLARGDAKKPHRIAKSRQGFIFHQWALRDSNPRPPACKAGALTKLS
jgi:hypothetical protein